MDIGRKFSKLQIRGNKLAGSPRVLFLENGFGGGWASQAIGRSSSLW